MHDPRNATALGGHPALTKTSAAACGILCCNGPAGRVTRSTRSHWLQEWSLLRRAN